MDLLASFVTTVSTQHFHFKKHNEVLGHWSLTVQLWTRPEFPHLSRVGFPNVSWIFLKKIKFSDPCLAVAVATYPNIHFPIPC